MHKKNCTVGIISWCDSKRFPRRFKVFKECIEAFKKYVPSDFCRTVIVDNYSSNDVTSYIKSLDCFDKKIFLPKNIQDIGAYAVLAKICRDFKTEYFLPIENDYVFFREDFIKPSIAMLEKTPNCGYVRQLKFEFKTKDVYDKVKNTKVGKNNPNAVRMYNLITGEKLFWAGPILDSWGNSYYINNWHWMTFGSLVSIETWEKIFPKLSGKIPAYQFGELAMMQNYQKLELQTLVLDGGSFRHLDPVSMYQTSFKRKIFVDSDDIQYYMENYRRFEA